MKLEPDCVEMTQKPRSRELIAVCTGCRKRSDKKTAASRASFGRQLHATSGTGRTTARRGSASSTTRRVISTKACGLLTKDTDREHTGAMKAASFVASTLATGSRTKCTVEAPSSIKTATGTTATGLMVSHKVKAA